MNMMKLYCQDSELRWLTGGFASISLDELNGKAEMMSRIDNKYVVDRWELESILPALMDEFDILEIEDRRAFTYDTRYFDDPDCSAYYEHHQGLRKGFKVRVRRYSDAGLCFLEVKVKGLRGMTIKNRQPYNPAQLGALTPEAHAFAAGIYSGHYGKAFDYDLRPSLDIQYQRITLVAKRGGERMTIDGKLSFRNTGKMLDAPKDVFIVETKSALGRGFADKVLRAVHARPTKKCSKYCIGMAALGAVTRWNRFMPTMRRLRLIEGTALAVQPHALARAV
ncbi:polyphosphate polymerase domain-containing protein [Marimonas arenosa]|uniref:Polyphosphate polymerase domain-containing protein n=1 Tax=Marimonas arenosa TaxID=1795305 RepID=A0AAE4B566_9RHOB|nr:polyphosphate polymerase domain-containing protein [Marimonas arenosa]MDQ2090832.1 polyphosphate polymerase domain-containing protein [Marimonas arenosa]